MVMKTIEARPALLSRRQAAGLALGAAALIASRPAFAHAHLASATPAVDSTVRSAPRQVSVSFTEKLEEKLSSLTVKDAQGRQVDASDTRFSDDSGKTLVVSLKEIGAGRYSVAWVAASVDTHRTTGTFGFTVRA